MKRLARMALLLAATSGCNAGNVFIASPSDYADYRSVRLADSYDARMAASHHYLEQHPDGRYSDRVKRFFDRTEPVFYKARRRNIDGLRAYLKALPHGPHAKEALALLMTFQNEERRREIEGRSVGNSAERNAAEGAGRRAAADVLMWWVQALSQPALWRDSFDRAPPELLARYRVALPQPICEPNDPEPGFERCGKTVVAGYLLRADGKRYERMQTLDIELTLDAEWRLVRVIVSGRALFVHAEEAASAAPLDERDEALAKAAAQRFVAELTKRLFAAELECNGGTDEKGITMLTCEQLQIRVEPGGTRGDDVFVFEPVLQPEPPAPEPPAPEPPAPEPPAPEPAAPEAPEPPAPEPPAP